MHPPSAKRSETDSEYVDSMNAYLGDKIGSPPVVKSGIACLSFLLCFLIFLGGK